MQRNTNRYAIYWAPEPDAPLGLFGNGWLGRDPAGGSNPVPVDVPEIPLEEKKTLTTAPARYGFHATLKPPFALVDGADEAVLLHAVRAFAAKTAAVEIDSMRVRAIGKFIAIVPDPVPNGLPDLAGACVRGLDDLRAPARADELARRRKAGLTPVQEALLQQWGYPYVMEEFRFHLTLSGLVADEKRRMDFVEYLSAAAGDTLGATKIADISVFRESAPGERFDLIARYPLSG